MNFQKTLLALSAAAFLGLNISCAQEMGDETGNGFNTEREINAPIDDSNDQSETLPVAPAPAAPEAKRNFSHIDPNNMIADKPLSLALAYFDANYSKIANKNYVTVIDFTKHSSQKRMFLINMSTGGVTAMYTSAGVGSDPDGDGHATLFSNVPDSRKSSLGYYLTGTTYEGGNGLSLRLHGLSSTNSKALERYIVIHGASYVSESSGRAGRSWGCPAVDNSLISGLTAKIKGGSLIYAWHEKYSTTTNRN